MNMNLFCCLLLCIIGFTQCIIQSITKIHSGNNDIDTITRLPTKFIKSNVITNKLLKIRGGIKVKSLKDKKKLANKVSFID